jgi:hypothetical protein
MMKIGIEPSEIKWSIENGESFRMKDGISKIPYTYKHYKSTLELADEEAGRVNIEVTLVARDTESYRVWEEGMNMKNSDMYFYIPGGLMYIYIGSNKQLYAEEVNELRAALADIFKQSIPDLSKII